MEAFKADTNNEEEIVLRKDVDQSQVTIRLTRTNKPGEFLIEAAETGYPPHYVVVTNDAVHTIRLVANLINRKQLAAMTDDELLKVDAPHQTLTVAMIAGEMATIASHPSCTDGVTYPRGYSSL